MQLVSTMRLVGVLSQFDQKIALQFYNTLRDGYATVKGIWIEFIEEVVAEVTGFPTNGKH